MRYYVECTEVSHEFLSGWGNAWQVFDRERTDTQGGSLPIALCVNRNAAIKIRDALNKK